MDKQLLINKILDFFTDIGIIHQQTSISSPTFLPGILIDNGMLLIDKDLLTHPGDLLHEAGHIAITPQYKRLDLSGDVHQCGHSGGDEMAAIAWSWMALKKMKLDPEVLFHSDGYKGASETYIKAFTSGPAFGFPLLGYFDMCDYSDPQRQPLGMSRWLRA
jgi:hypothetical protein